MNLFEFLGMILIISAINSNNLSITESIIIGILGVIACVWIGEKPKVYKEKKEAGK